MSDPTSLDVPDSPPPPAYELSQQDFDQKTSHVLETSHAEASTSRIVEENGEEWQVWDDALFAAAAAKMTIGEGSSSSTSQSEAPSVQFSSGKGKMEESIAETMLAGNVQPLRIKKKGKALSPPPPKEKERPSWYKEAQLDQHSPSPHGSASQTPMLPGAALSRSGTLYDDRERTPPPLFEAVGPSLDGPPYHEPTVIMTYNPSSTPSRPASPLNSPPLHTQPLASPSSPISPTSTSSSSRRSLPPPPSAIASPPPSAPAGPRIPSPPSRQNVTAHRSMPAPLRPAGSINRRPMTTYSAAHDMVGPRVAFNHQMAYTKRPFGALPEEPIPRVIDPASFYSSAVSSHVTPNTSGLPRSSMASVTQQPRPGSMHVASPMPTPAMRTPSPLLHSNGGYQPGTMYRDRTNQPSQLSASLSNDSTTTYNSPTMTYPSTSPAPSHTSSNSNTSYFSPATTYATPTTYTQQQGNTYPTTATGNAYNTYSTPATNYTTPSNQYGSTNLQGYGSYGQATPQQPIAQYNTNNGYGVTGQQQNWSTTSAYNNNQYTRPW